MEDPTDSTVGVPMAVPEKQSTEEMGKQGSLIAGSSVAPTAAVAESPKVSLMASKAGMNFVIPKNKLFGALIPVTKSGSKWEPCEPKKEDPTEPLRKTKWGPDLTQDASVKRGRALALQTRAEQIAAQLESGNLEVDNNGGVRSPSPPPIYDSNGHRINTREGRKREQLDLERREAIGECLKLNPSYKPPSGYKAVLKEAKLFIPAKEYPGYNFIGLILGPRGNTQKRMEAETGTKITIRGKGAVKEGKLQIIRRDGKEIDGAFEDLHVHITADTSEKVDAAVALIEPLLTPVDEDRNTHKMKQLRELAEMNGTIRDFTRACTLCGEIGHREWQCPKDKLTTFQAKVICRFCGDGGHPSIDCPLKLSGQGKVLDKEYLNFLEELGSGLGGIDPSGKDAFPNASRMTYGAANSELNSRAQPMLLTASGAQPMPRWLASAPGSEATPEYTSQVAADCASDFGGFPRFPFPIPPGGRMGRGGFNFFLPPFFHPGLIPFGGVAFFRGRPFHPMMALGPRGMFPPFRGRFPFPPFGLRPDMRPPSTSTTPDSQPSSLPMHSSEQEEQVQASGVVEGGEAQCTSKLFDESHPADLTAKESQNPDAAAVASAVSAMATSPISSVPLPFFSAATVPPFSSATGSTIPSFPSTVMSMPPPTLLSPAAMPPVMPPSAPPPSAPPPPLPPAPPPPAPPATVLPLSPVRHVVPSVRPVLPSVRPAIPPVGHFLPSSATSMATSGPSLRPSGIQMPSFTPIGALGQAPSVSVSSWDGTTNNNVSAPIASNIPRPQQPWNSTTVAFHPIWSQSQHPQASASPQQSSVQVFAWQKQIPNYSSQAVDEASPSKLMAYAPRPTQHSPALSMAFPRPSSAAVAVADNSSLQTWGKPPPATPPLPPPSPGPIPAPPSFLPASQIQSFTQASPVPTPTSVQPVFSSFTPLHQGSQGPFNVPSLPASNNPNGQPLAAVPHTPSHPRFLSPPLLGPQIRLASPSNATTSVPTGDNPPLSSLSQHTPIPLQSFSFQPQENPRVSHLAQVPQQSSSFTNRENLPARPWQLPSVQTSVPTRSQPSSEFRNSTIHQAGYGNADWTSSSSSYAAPSEDVQGLKRPPFFPQTAVDRGRNFNYDSLASVPPSSMHPVLQQPFDRPRLVSAGQEQNTAATHDFLSATHISPLGNVRPGLQQAWVQPETGAGQKWAENSQSTGLKPQLHSTGMPQTQEVDPEYEKLMASVGVT